MANSTRGFTPSADANRFPKPFSEEFARPKISQEQRCTWPQCPEPQWAGPVCFAHAVEIHGFVRRFLGIQDEQIASRPETSRPEFVYYLMVGPATVKIGTTTNLRGRIAQLRSDMQYVVAIEAGGRATEQRRHRQFAAERVGRREDFRLSDRLKQHIETLQPARDRLLAQAL